LDPWQVKYYRAKSETPGVSKECSSIGIVNSIAVWGCNADFENPWGLGCSLFFNLARQSKFPLSSGFRKEFWNGKPIQTENYSGVAVNFASFILEPKPTRT